MLLLASMFGAVNAVEVHKNGFGGITPLNTTGLTVFNDDLKRSFDYESDSLVLSAEFSILETNGDIRDFSLFDNDLTRQNTTVEESLFVDSTFRTGLQTLNAGIQNQNLTATADSFVGEAFPTTNYGSLTYLLVRSFTTSNRRAFLQWNLSSIPPEATITDATMWILKTSDTGSFPRTYEAQAVLESWTEGGITWNNQPGTMLGSPVSISITTADIWYSWDITTIVQNWVDGTWTNNGLRIKDSAEGSGSGLESTWNSREAATDDPSLNVSYTTSQWAETPHSESLDMENTNVSMIWWGQTHNIGRQYITGKGCSTSPYVYGIWLDPQNEISARVAESNCIVDGAVSSNLPTGGLQPNRTYGVGVVFEDNPWGADVHFWLDGEWIYNETSIRRVEDTNTDYYVGRSNSENQLEFCNCTHDEILVFKERLSNDTMKLLTTKQHDIVIRSGPRTTTQGFEGLFFALPWLIVFSLIGWIFYLIAISWKEVFTKE